MNFVTKNNLMKKMLIKKSELDYLKATYTDVAYECKGKVFYNEKLIVEYIQNEKSKKELDLRTGKEMYDLLIEKNILKNQNVTVNSIRDLLSKNAEQEKLAIVTTLKHSDSKRQINHRLYRSSIALKFIEDHYSKTTNQNPTLISENQEVDSLKAEIYLLKFENDRLKRIKNLTKKEPEKEEWRNLNSKETQKAVAILKNMSLVTIGGGGARFLKSLKEMDQKGVPFRTGPNGREIIDRLYNELIANPLFNTSNYENKNQKSKY